MKRGELWVKVPLEPAMPWFQLDYYDRIIGRELFMFMGHDQTRVGTMQQVVEAALRGLAVDPRHRKRFRQAVERFQEAGLLIESEGAVLLLYSASFWERHRAASEQEANKKRAGSEQEENKKLARSGQGVVSQPDQTPRNHSIPARPKIDRSIERAEERAPASGVFETLPLALESTAAIAAPPTPKGPRKVCEKRALFTRILAALAREHRMVTPTLSQKAIAAGLARATEYAELRSLPFEDALGEMLRGCYDLIATGRSSAMQWALRDWQPASAKKARPYGVADPSPASSFADTSIGDDFIAECEALGYVLEAAQ